MSDPSERMSSSEREIRLRERVMLNPIIAEYVIADRAAQARRQADRARLARLAVTETRAARAARKRAASGTPSRWRAWGWSLTPRAFGSARLLSR
jgi:hypothetical protein